MNLFQSNQSIKIPAKKFIKNHKLFSSVYKFELNNLIVILINNVKHHVNLK